MSALITFSIPALLLAMVSPYSIKLMEVNSDNVGSISERLSSISTLGSIFGTFFTGFFLIPTIGNLILVGFNFLPTEVKSEEYSDMIKREVVNFDSDKEIFTDDYAPVEKYCL